MDASGFVEYSEYPWKKKSKWQLRREKLYRSLLWFLHNTVAHPVIGVTQTLNEFAEWLHDATLPNNERFHKEDE